MPERRRLEVLARARPSELARRRARALARYLREELYPFSPFQRARLEAAGLGPRFPAQATALERLPPIGRAVLEREFALVGDLSTLAVLPGPQALRARGGFARKLALVLGGRRARALLASSYRPALVTWDTPPGRPPLPVPWTPIDLDLAAEQVALALEAHGLSLPRLRILLLAPEEEAPAVWMLRVAALSSGATLLTPPARTNPATLAALAARAPSIVAGAGESFARTLEEAARAGLRLPDLRAVLVAGERPKATDPARLAAAIEALGAPDARVVRLALLHLPRLVLFSCAADPTAGWHASPERFELEVLDGEGRPVAAGETGTLTATALAGHGVPPLRLALELRVCARGTACDACGLPLPVLAFDPDRAP